MPNGGRTRAQEFQAETRRSACVYVHTGAQEHNSRSFSKLKCLRTGRRPCSFMFRSSHPRATPFERSFLFLLFHTDQIYHYFNQSTRRDILLTKWKETGKITTEMSEVNSNNSSVGVVFCAEKTRRILCGVGSASYTCPFAI